jgi:hypothetical protein
MKTTHFENSIAVSTTARDELSGMIIRNIHQQYGRRWRAVEAGAGIVILPETDRFSDCTGHELVKALGLSKEWDKSIADRVVKALSRKPEEEREVEKETKPTVAYKNILFQNNDTSEFYLASLTPDQMRLLNWLHERELLFCEVNFQSAPTFEKI